MRKHFSVKKAFTIFNAKLHLMKPFMVLLMLGYASLAWSNTGLETQLQFPKSSTTIRKVVESITKDTDYSFIYKSKDLNLEQVVAVQSNSDINELLKTITDETGLGYTIDKNTIVLFKKPAQSKVTQQEPTSNQEEVTGTILDNYGESIIGAHVTIKGTTRGTITDLDGRFTLQASKGEVIEVSFIGYKTQDVKYTGQKDIVVEMTEDTELLDEVVVIGYGVQKKANLSGSVASIGDKSLKDRPVTNIAQALQGTAGNLNITINSGQATATPDINIRGITSINGGGPLIVIDGIVSSDGELKDLNPSDVQDISILKDASSAAIYGARAAFGVVIVTTKGGRSKGPEKLKVNYDNNFGFRKIAVRPDLITDPSTVVDMKNKMSSPFYELYDENAIAYAKKRSQDPNGTSPYFLNTQGVWEYFGDTNWYDEAYRDWGFSTTHNINISGATERASYYLSGGYQKTDGMLKRDNDIYNRYNFRLKLDFKVTDWLSIGNNTSYATTDYDAPTYLGGDYYWNIFRMNPLDTPRNPDGSWTKTGAESLGRMEDGGRRENLTQRLQTQFTAKVKLYKDIWTLTGNFALNRYNSNSEWAYLTIPYSEGPKLEDKFFNSTSSAAENNSRTDNIIFDIYTNFNKTFAEKHDVTVMAGFNQEEQNYKYFATSVNDLISQSLPSIGLATGDKSVSADRSSYALRGAFYRLGYIYNNKYIFEHNGRYDGTSRFPRHDRFVYNPSVSLAWVISQENFFQPITNVVSHLKLRGSIGSLGNQNVSDYPYFATMGKGRTSWILDGEQPIYVSAPGLVSNNLTWETVVTKNIGFDLNLFENKLTTSFDYYIRDTKDMLVRGTPLPTILGTSVPNENAANLETKGWELSIGWNDSFKLIGKDFNYYANFILSDNQAKITKFSNPTGTLDSYYVGQRFGEIWGLTTEGYFLSDEDVRTHADQKAVTAYPGTFPLAPGDLKFKDLNGDGEINWGSWTLDNPGDFKVIGNTTPRYNFSFNAGFDWNNFDFSILLQGVGKRDYYPGSGDLYFWGIYSQPWTNVLKGNMDYWTPDNPNAYFPRRKAYTAEMSRKELGANQTKYLQDASYMRLKNLTIGYTLPKELTRKWHIEKLRVFFVGENLAEITGLDKHYKVDPEGLGGQMYPLNRIISFGLNLTL